MYFPTKEELIAQIKLDIEYTRNNYAGVIWE
jgi:hypothetical protein